MCFQSKSGRCCFPTLAFGFNDSQHMLLVVPGVYSASPKDAASALQASAGSIEGGSGSIDGGSGSIDGASIDYELIGGGGGGSGVTSLDLCPIVSFREALKLVSSLLPNATKRAGGLDTIADHYETRYGQAECPGFLNEKAWPPSQRLKQGRPGLVINAGEGTTGTRCYHQVFRKLGLTSGHWNHELRSKSVWRCTNGSWSDDADCTAAYDAYDVVSDTPVAYQLPYLLSSHPGQAFAGALLTIRDPLDWAISRHTHHTDSDDIMNAVPCGCRVGWDDLALPSKTNRLDARHPLRKCAALEEVSTSVEGQQRTLIYDAWAACIIKEAHQRVFLLNPYELSRQQQATQLADALKGLGAFPANLSAAQIEVAMRDAEQCS